MYHLECCLFKDKISFIALKPEQILRKCWAVAWKAASSFKTSLKALIVKAEKNRKKSLYIIKATLIVILHMKSKITNVI